MRWIEWADYPLGFDYLPASYTSRRCDPADFRIWDSPKATNLDAGQPFRAKKSPNRFLVDLILLCELPAGQVLARRLWFDGTVHSRPDQERD
jgi:hypothetical protein